MPLVPHTPSAEAPEHANLIVALDAGDLAGVDRERAEALLRACAGCAALAADLVAIRGALAALPAPARRRDYRLTEADAARLRPDRRRRLLGWLAAPRSSVRPLATGLATLGIVGLLVSSGLPGLGSSSSAPLETVGSPVQNPVPAATSAPGGGAGFGSQAAPAAATAAPAAVPGAALPGAAQSAAPLPPANVGADAATDAGAGAESSPGPAGGRNSGAAPVAVPTDQVPPVGKAAPPASGVTAGPSPAIVVSAGLLAAGILLLLARVLAVRRTR